MREFKTKCDVSSTKNKLSVSDFDGGMKGKRPTVYVTFRIPYCTTERAEGVVLSELEAHRLRAWLDKYLDG
jgi:hypothetical protein